MPHTSRPILAALVTLAYAALAHAEVNFTPYELVAQDGSKAQVERGEILVPENRAHPDGRKLRLGFVRLSATRPSTRPPIVYLAGGPGGSGVDAARAPARFAIFMALREVADVIAFDQRGTGWSNQIPPCPTFPSLPLDRATTRDSLTNAVQSAARTCAAFWKDAGIDLDAYNTWESAADVDALRAALGVQKISLWGISYGSHLGLAILKRYPGCIARGAFVGIEGLDETVKLPSLTDTFLARLQATIARDAAAARAYPDFLGTMRRVHARLESAPVHVPVQDSSTGAATTLVIGKLDVQLAATALTSDPERSRLLPALYAMMDAGDFSRVAPIVYEALRKPGAWRLNGMSAAMDVASGVSPARARRFEREARDALLGHIVNFPMPHVGDALGVADLGERFRAPLRSAVPVLFLSGTLDGRTYPESARQIASGFRNGRHVIVENGGHNLFEASPLIKDLIVRWFRGDSPRESTLTLPPPDFPR
jgi:pimeloyl-ACP methyl ester carboxylesterase